MSEWKETTLGEISTDVSYGYTESANSEPVGPKSFEIDENDRICISQQACIDSIKTVETFFNEITDFALRVFPDRHQYVDDGTEPF